MPYSAEVISVTGANLLKCPTLGGGAREYAVRINVETVNLELRNVKTAGAGGSCQSLNTKVKSI